MKVIADLDVCDGYAICMMEAPDVFDLDEEANKVILLMDNPPERLRAETEAAVRGCPAKALRLDD